MARLEKLAIQGCRSFGHEDEDIQNINFMSGAQIAPLTMILGQNGCGKTTIIECLRYVTTGDFPPGSSAGRSFVHDPKMARENSVSAMVKLQLTGLDNNRYIISRNVELMQKARTVQLKTLDSTLTRTNKDTNKKESLTLKCADMNNHVFLKLGVSKPILNYVIFCHQEDSNWPLDESSKVKDKFDEIFASAKYKNCLKKIKEVRAEHMTTKKLEEKELEYLRKDKEYAEDKRKDVKRKETSKNAIADQVQELAEKMTPLTDELQNIKEIELNFSGIQEKITEAKTNRRNAIENAQQVRDIEHFDEIPLTTTDSEVDNMKDTVETEKEQKEEERKENTDDLEKLKAVIENQVLKAKKASAIIGECKSRESQNQINESEVLSMLESYGEELGWHQKDFKDMEEKEAALGKLKKHIREKEMSIKKTTENFDDKINGIQNHISGLGIKRAQLEESRKIKDGEISKNKDAIKAIQRSIRELEGSAAKLSEIRSKHDRKDKELQTELSSIDVDALRQDLESKKRDHRQLSKRHEDLREEKNTLDTQRAIRSELKLKKEDLNEKERTTDKILSKNRSEMTEFFGEEGIPDTARLKERFDRLAKEAATTTAELSAKRQKLKAENESKTQVRKALRKEVNAKDDKVKQFERKLAEILDPALNLEEEIERCKVLVEDTRQQKQMKEANKWTYKEFIDKLQKVGGGDPCCPTCMRKFQKNSEVQELIRDLEKEIDKIPSKLQSIDSRFKKAVAKLETLQNLLPNKKQTDDLRLEVEEKGAELKKLEVVLKDNEKKLSELEDECDVAEVSHALSGQLREDVLNVGRMHSDAETLRERVAELERTLPHGGHAADRDYEVVKEEEEEVAMSLAQLRTEADELQQKEIRHKERVNSLQTVLNALVTEKLTIEGRQQERTNMERERNKLEAAVRDLDASVAAIARNQAPLKDEIEEATANKRQAVAEKERDLDALRRDLDNVKAKINKLNDLVQGLNNYEESRNKENMDELMMKYKQLELRTKENEERKVDLENKGAAIEKFINDTDLRRRNIDDNINLRKQLRQKKAAEATIAKGEKQLETMDYTTVAAKKTELIKKYNSLNADKMSKEGRLSEMNNSIKDLKRELNSDKLKLAESRYKEKNLMCRLRAHAIDDLNKYYKAMDSAIMNFHRERMRTINKFIRELWRATYRGNDIDYIEIKTDEEGTMSAGADKKKNYNYKVVMLKNETEMDMRGRCSAGQKVLASIIIRLALAETFSSKCGVLALDEPTTNLDRDNITSLACALSDIVVKRSRQKNFQLIIITHDDDLITQLSRNEQVSHYFRVTRNAQGLSQIRKKAVETVNEGFEDDY